MFLRKRQDLRLYIVVRKTRVGVSTIILSKRLQPYRTGQYCCRMSPFVTILILAIITTPSTISQSALAAANFSTTTPTTGDAEYNSFTLFPSNQSTRALSVEKTDVTQEDSLVYKSILEDGINYCSLPLMNSIDAILT